MSRQKTAETEELYRRVLPGGGHVTIRVTRVSPLIGRAHYEGEVVLERRSEVQRREGHVAPVVARYEGLSTTAVLHELFPLAHSNAALAVACMARRPRREIRVENLVAIA
jgi:hypothetical protein